MAIPTHVGRVRPPTKGTFGNWKIWVPVATVVVPLVTALLTGVFTLTPFVSKLRADPAKPDVSSSPSNSFSIQGDKNIFRGPVINGNGNTIGLTAKEQEDLFRLLLEHKSVEAEKLAAEIKAKQDSDSMRDRRREAFLDDVAQKAADKATQDWAAKIEMGMGYGAYVANVESRKYNSDTKMMRVVAHCQWSGAGDSWASEPRSGRIALDLREGSGGLFSAFGDAKYFDQNDKVLDLSQAALKVELAKKFLGYLNQRSNSVPAPTPYRYIKP